MAIETSDWPVVRLGIHEFRTPPDFTRPVMTATIDAMSLDVLKNQPGRPEDVAAAQGDVGKILRREQIGDWTILIAEEDMGLIVSNYTYLVLGFWRVGADLVMTRDAIDRTAFPDGNDPSKWAFHQGTVVRPDQPGTPLADFVFKGLAFDSRTAKGPVAASFTASAVLADATGQPVSEASGDNNYHLSFITEPGDPVDGGRPLATPDDVAQMPGVDVRNSTLTVDGASAGFSRVDMRLGEDRQVWFDGTIFWPNGDRAGANLTSAHLKFVNAQRPEDEAEARALGLLTSIREVR